MPNSRQRCSPSDKVRELRLRCRVYSSQRSSPRLVLIDVDDNDRVRYPHVERRLDDEHIQPFVHDCNLTVRDGRSMRFFRVFFKWHVGLGVNFGLPGNATGRLPFRGDVIVMRVGAIDARARHVTKCAPKFAVDRPVVNMRSGDSSLADRVVIRFAREIVLRRQLDPGARPPRKLSFTIDTRGSRRSTRLS